jgi:hypothetical protein
MDLDGGGVTLGFPSSGSGFFDYGVPIPDGTDLIIVCPGDPLDEISEVHFGFGTPSDPDGNGVADNATQIGRRIGSVIIPAPVPFNPPADICRPADDCAPPTWLQFYDLGDFGVDKPFPANFFLAINDTSGDLDINSVEIVAAGG